MIVKNEAKVIERCFDSVNSFVDEYVICDTGSTDGTQEVMQNYWDRHGFTGEIINRPWVSFSHNRQEVFDLGKGRGDYIMTIDADEIFCSFEDNKPLMDRKVSSIPQFVGDRIEVSTYFPSLVYNRSQFFKDGLDWKWQWPIHEACSASDEKHVEYFTGVCVCPTDDGNPDRIADENHFHKDALVFENWVLDNPEDGRAWFYLAQSYRDAKKPALGVPALKKCIEFSNWGEERYLAALRVGRYRLEAGEPMEDLINDFLMAHNLLPHRLEALYTVVAFYRQKDQFHTAIMLGEQALNTPLPTDRLFVEPDTYEWKLKDEIAVAYYWVGRYEESLALTQEALDNPRANISEESRERMLKNVKYAEEAIADAAKQEKSNG